MPRTGHDTKVASWSELEDRQPAYALVGGVDLVVIRFDDAVSVLYGRCQHRDAIMADGHIDGRNLICGVHGWDYQYETGVSEYNNAERLEKFSAVIDRDQDAVLVDASEIAAFESVHPQYFRRDEYLGKISKEQRAGEWKVWETSLVNPNFAEYAKLCGAKGIRVESPDVLDRALQDALTHEGPALVEIVTDALLI